MRETESESSPIDSRDWPQTEPLAIESLAVEVYRAPIAHPVRTAFGTMRDRPAVVVKVRSTEGVTGYGEVWCNFPETAAEYRSRLIASVLGPMVVGRRWTHPTEVFVGLSAQTRLAAVQAGETGPFSQAIAGIDIAMWDMAARRAGMPLWQLLGGKGHTAKVSTYASGIGPDRVEKQVTEARAAGHRAFKLKVGFGPQIDLGNLAMLRRLVGPRAPIAVDANQAWSPEEAAEFSQKLAVHHPIWLEEPIPVDLPARVWKRLSEISPIPLAGGENLYGPAAFRQAIRAGALAVIQPDLTKWGGISGCLPVAGRALEAGRRFCPHSLGGGIGLLASAHLMTAVGCEDLLEMDCNPNPLREGLAQPFPQLADGKLVLSAEPGLGVVPDQKVATLRISTTDLGS